MRSAFDNMWFDIPIPFKPGDIVCDCFDNIPFVITSTVPWYRKENTPKRERSTNHLCSIDMNASGYSVIKDTASVKYYHSIDWGYNKEIMKHLGLEKYTKITNSTASID